jgi:predicted Zn-dependent protease
MASISLRAYDSEIETMIEHEQAEEAVAHCMHILQSVPKHIATYRLLGKALLEIHRFTDATDIFNRVLSSVPDDFVSHVGMSIIRENENNLDGAIWHMERAYEAQPANAAIQDELRRLYGLRWNGPQNSSARGALAACARGQLYQQAIESCKPLYPKMTAAIYRQRLMYYQSGQRRDPFASVATF